MQHTIAPCLAGTSEYPASLLRHAILRCLGDTPGRGALDHLLVLAKQHIGVGAFPDDLFGPKPNQQAQNSTYFWTSFRGHLKRGSTATLPLDQFPAAGSLERTR